METPHRTTDITNSTTCNIHLPQSIEVRCSIVAFTTYENIFLGYIGAHVRTQVF